MAPLVDSLESGHQELSMQPTGAGARPGTSWILASLAACLEDIQGSLFK